MSAVEKAAYDPHVDVFFRANAWMDDATCMGWTKRSFFFASVKGDGDVVPSEQSLVRTNDR